MPRKTTDTVQIGLRIREAVRQRVAREAKKNQVSINREMARRIEQSFEIGAIKSIEDVAADLASTWARVRKASGIGT